METAIVSDGPRYGPETHGNICETEKPSALRTCTVGFRFQFRKIACTLTEVLGRVNLLRLPFLWLC